MPLPKTYSFSDVILTLSHPSLGQVSTNGMGVGSVAKSMRTDRSAIDVAADGVPVISKIKDGSGQLQITVQQISDINTTLKKWFNYLSGDSTPTSEWAQISAVLTSRETEEQDIYRGGAFVKLPDTNYQTQAENVTWTILFADIVQNTI